MKSTKHPLAFTRNIALIWLLFAAFTLGTFSIYWARGLRGNIDNHILSSVMFGVPSELAAKGLKPMMTAGPPDCGWDGQFYYYTSNDIFATKDTAAHVDATSYRYQRIGFSLFAAAVAKLCFQSWVSPAFYFWTYFALLSAATVAGALLIRSLGGHPALILLWSLSVGTQVTLFNALPDAAADAFLIIALLAVRKRHFALSILPFALSALSREVYTLFPSFILATLAIGLLLPWDGTQSPVKRVLSGLKTWRGEYLLVLPGLAAALWRVYVTRHFGASPSSQAFGIVGKPFASWWEYTTSGLAGHHKLVGDGRSLYGETATDVLFMVVLVLAAWLVLRALRRPGDAFPGVVRGFAVTSGVLACLYASFGPTVMMHYTGYFKAAALFFFAVPLLLVASGVTGVLRAGVIAVLTGTVVVTTMYNLDSRVLADNNISGSDIDRYTHASKEPESERIACFGEYHATVRIERLTVQGKAGQLIGFLGGKRLVVADVAVTNTGVHDFRSTRSIGSTHVSSAWVDVDGKVVGDGIRSSLPDVLRPGETTHMKIVSWLPDESGLQLRPILIQEGCSWVYADKSDAPAQP